MNLIIWLFSVAFALEMDKTFNFVVKCDYKLIDCDNVKSKLQNAGIRIAQALEFTKQINVNVTFYPFINCEQNICAASRTKPIYIRKLR